MKNIEISFSPLLKCQYKSFVAQVSVIKNSNESEHMTMSSIHFPRLFMSWEAVSQLHKVDN